ncbi:MAG: OmpA family protein [Sulfurimonas sp.]|nr:OmpA family protein [Sulfurimonas sp.]
MKTLFFSLLLLSELFAKNMGFSVIIDKPFNDVLYDITEDYDRSITAVGFSQNFESSKSQEAETYTDPFEYLASLSGGQGTQMHLVKVDEGGEILLSKAAALSLCNEAVSVVKRPDNGYFVGGHTLEGSFLFLKLDTNANIIYSKTFGTKFNDKMSKLIALKDGGALAIGSSVTSRDANDPLFASGLGLGDISITRISKEGEIRWSKKYGTKNDDKGVTAVEANDGSLIIAGASANGPKNALLLMRLTENGEKIWLKEYNAALLLKPYKLIQLKDENFLLSLTQHDTPQKEQIRLIKFDLEKNILLDKKIITTYASALKDIAEFSDSNIIGVGYVRDKQNTDALVMLLDANLNMKTQEHYGSKNYESFNALKILHNSQVAVAGVYTYENSQESNMWIAKLNKDASMAQISSSSDSLFAALKKAFADEINKKFLTIRSDLTIELIDPSLYFKVGEYKLTNAQKTFLNSFGVKLIKFLDDHKKSIEALEVNGHTSSEWGGVDFTQQYLNNEKLSLERSYSVLSYLFTKQNAATQKWLSKILIGSGFSFSKKVVFESSEDFEKSRRVAFKIVAKK